LLDEPPTDPVTGALPRTLLQPRLADEVARSGGFAVFLFDVDYFKTVNDSYGHLRGDQVLRQLADRIKGLVRGGDVLFRYGGDEFVLLLPSAGRTEALRLALRLTDEVRAHEFAGEPALHLSISLGLAVYPEDATDADTLLNVADRRNYLAKRRGRGGAVADDVAVGADPASSRLWERDAALATAQEFLTRLLVDGRGALRVSGEPGAGHTRFLHEVAAVAAMRGFRVVQLPAPGLPAVPADSAGIILIADVDAARHAPTAAAELATAPVPVGLVYAATGGASPPPDARLPLLAAAELAPWSPAALRIWLRTTLQGEPSRTLLNWTARHSGGLPARAARELTRLRSRGGLVSDEAGRWTVAPTMLGRALRRSALPVPMTPLVGREKERDQVVRLVRGGRLVTLTGPGGIGKTRLSLSAAAKVADDFDGGAVFVPLAEAADTDMVVAAIAQALQVAEVPGMPLFDVVVEHLSESSVLLVLDNFEQVLDAAPVVTRLLAGASGVSALVTSREPLSLYGEQVYAVPPLPLPDLTTLRPGEAGVARALADSPAVALFDQRARAVNAEFTLTPAALPAVVALCRRLDGLPLAIELAAARTDRWAPEALLANLTEHLDALGSGPRDLPARQQTLRGAIDWSFDLLDGADRRLFVALAVFVGGCTVDAALAVAGTDRRAGDDAGQRRAAMVERLAALADKSLLSGETDPDGQRRYRMLETIRAYAMQRLLAAADADAVRERHAAYYVAFAERAGDGMTGPEQADWADRIVREYQNVRAAVGWVLARGRADQAASLCLGLWRYWRNGNHIGEGREWLDAVLAAGMGPPDPVRARVLHGAAVLAATQDDHESAERFGLDSLRLAEAVGDRPTMAHAHNALGIAAISSGDYHLATAHFQASLEIWRELDQPQGTAAALGNLAKLFLRLGDVAAAHGHAEQCLRLERAAGNTRGIVLGLECLGQIRLAQNDVAGARASLAESLVLNRALGDLFGEAMSLHQLGLAAFADGDRAEALELLTAGLALRHEVGDREDLAVSLDCVAEVVAAADPALAVRLVAAAGALRERHRLPIPPDADARRRRTLGAARAELSERAYAAAWAAGRTTPLDLMVDQALDCASPTADAAAADTRLSAPTF
jgi:diguanylate cyclase (GGDEF)-like protein